MSSIAYITDSYMLDFHRLNSSKTMNFWRLSSNINFKNFNVGDIVFFLSKDKNHLREKEKGIIGYGVFKEAKVASINTLWKNYTVQNGYNNLNDFKQAVMKVSKDHKVPSKMSSLYLENVVFYQTPLYLSDFGFTFSNNVESFIYLDSIELTLNLLKTGANQLDIWSNIDADNNGELIKINYCVNEVHKIIGDYKLSERKIKKIYKSQRDYVNNHNLYDFVQNSRADLVKVDNDYIEIVLYHDKDIDDRLLIGNAVLYKSYLTRYLGNEIKISIKSSDSQLQDILNSL